MHVNMHCPLPDRVLRSDVPKGGSKRNICENKPDPTTRVVALWGSPGYGRPVRILGRPVRDVTRSGLKRSLGSFQGRPSPFIAGLSADAMIAPWVIKGAMNFVPETGLNFVPETGQFSY